MSFDGWVGCICIAVWSAQDDLVEPQNIYGLNKDDMSQLLDLDDAESGGVAVYKLLQPPATWIIMLAGFWFALPTDSWTGIFNGSETCTIGASTSTQINVQKPSISISLEHKFLLSMWAAHSCAAGAAWMIKRGWDKGDLGYVESAVCTYTRCFRTSKTNVLRCFPLQDLWNFNLW